MKKSPKKNWQTCWPYLIGLEAIETGYLQITIILQFISELFFLEMNVQFDMYFDNNSSCFVLQDVGSHYMHCLYNEQ